MFNHARGLWGYTGTASDGGPLTIQATGLGAASAAIVTAELCALGLATFVRIGTARSLHAGSPAPGDVLAVTGALAGDGPSRALGAPGTVLPDAPLTALLQQQTGAAALVATADLLVPDAGRLEAWARSGARACDLQTATVLQVARTHGRAAAAVLVVTGTVTSDAGAAAFDDAALLAAVTVGAHAAAAALGVPSRDTPPLPPPRDDERVSV
ncbi:MAG: purine-nucleoside phosphorylase [Solirubrobacterales bacterium]|nr:purine-nucleoside phosphorylase [Solirubrobacterales bacterium]